MTDKQMYWATIGVMLIVGFLGGYLYREIAPKVGEMIPYSCTYEGSTYRDGASVPSGDRCNSCSCQNGQVSCTMMRCVDDPVDPNGSGGTSTVGEPILPGQSDMAKIPDGPLASASNPKTPVSVQYVVEHRSALDGKTVRVTGVVVANWLTQQECIGERCTLMESNVQPSIFLADTADQSRNQLYDLRITVSESAQLPAGQYAIGTTATVTGQVSGSLEGVMMSYGLVGGDPGRY